ncbi:hypothetical protein JMJ77_0013496, partial [Colletotrichum scovillei]
MNALRVDHHGWIVRTHLRYRLGFWAGGVPAISRTRSRPSRRRYFS